MTEDSQSGDVESTPGETLANVLRRKIADEILEGRFPPHTRLDEHGLAIRFGVSRTPVREALRQLAASGLVIVRPRRGAVVRSIDKPRLMELFEAEVEMEALCARLAAMRMTLLERHRLQEIHSAAAEAVRTNDAHGYYLANRSFHQAIMAGCHNMHLAQAATLIRAPAAPYRKNIFAVTDRMHASYAEHEAIIAAIFKEDPDAAYAAMKRHVSTGSIAIFSGLEQAQSRLPPPSKGDDEEAVA